MAVPGMGPLLAARVGDDLLAALPRPRRRAESQHPPRPMDFMLDQVFAAAGDAVPAPTPPRALRVTSWGCRSCRRPTSSTTGSTAPRYLQIRYKFVGDLSPAVTAVVDPDKLTWVEHSDLRPGRPRVRYRLAPDHYADRLQSSGSCAITDAPTGAASAP